MSNNARNIVILGAALVAVFLALERFTWWIPEWLPAYRADPAFATKTAWLFVQNVVIFAVVGLLLTAILRGGFSSAWLAMIFGLSYGAGRLILYSFGILPEAPFWLHPLVLAVIGISPLIGTAVGAFAFRCLDRNRKPAT